MLIMVYSCLKSIYYTTLTCDLLFIIIIVAGGEELSKDKSGHKDLLHLVLHHRNAPAIVPHADGVVLTEIRSIESFFLLGPFQHNKIKLSIICVLSRLIRENVVVLMMWLLLTAQLVLQNKELLTHLC